RAPLVQGGEGALPLLRRQGPAGRPPVGSGSAVMFRGTLASFWALCVAAPATLGAAQVTTDVPAVLPAAVVDLRTQEGAALVQASWRYSDVKVTEIDHHAAGADLKP